MNWRTLTKITFLLLNILMMKMAQGDVEVIRQAGNNILISHSEETTWEIDDKVCFTNPEGDEELGCGEVRKANSQGAIVRIEDRNIRLLETGDRVQRYDFMYLYPNMITGGIAFGPSYFFPYLQYQIRISRKFALGVQAIYTKFSQNDVSIQAYGGNLTLSYFNSKPYPGFWLQAGLGYYNIDIERNGVKEKTPTPVGFATVGWRGKWKTNITVGAGIGIQYVNPDPSLVRLKFDGIEPLGVLDFGFLF